MSQLIGNIPALIILVAIIGLLVYAGFRIGLRFLIKRLAGLVFVVIGVTFVTFILGYVTPGNAIYVLCGERCTPHYLATLEHQYGLDLPWYEQYARFLNNLIHFNLGLSFTERGREVWTILQTAVPISVQLGLTALVLALIIGIPLGVVAAVRSGTRFDTLSMGGALLVFALPTFVTIPFYDLLIIFLAKHNLPHLPVSGWGDPLDIIAPVIILAGVNMGFYARLARGSMLDVLNQDYIRTARAKGLAERTVIIRHAFRNALVPLITAIGPGVAFVVAGAFFTETLFGIPGIGYTAVVSVQNKDMPVVQATVVLVALAVAVMNLLVDIVYGLLDPRIKVS